jgi:hypothetical protein
MAATDRENREQVPPDSNKCRGCGMRCGERWEATGEEHFSKRPDSLFCPDCTARLIEAEELADKELEGRRNRGRWPLDDPGMPRHRAGRARGLCRSAPGADAQGEILPCAHHHKPTSPGTPGGRCARTLRGQRNEPCRNQLAPPPLVSTGFPPT